MPASSVIPQATPTPVCRADPTTRSLARLGSAPRLLLIGCVALIVLIAGMRAWVCWGNDAWLNHPAGVLISMASDLKAGVFYRPIYGPAGYGGTRYFPLYFVLQAALMKLGMPILLSAYVLSAAAVGALLAGMFCLLRALGVESWLAACSTGALLAANCAQYSLFSPHADGLACALNVWALVFVTRPKLTRGKVAIAALLFTLAWSAKLTTVFGFGAAFVWLLGIGLAPMAWALAVETICGYLMVAAALVLGSEGRFWEILKACASGGTSLLGAVAAPLNMLMVAARLDQGILWFAALAVLALAQVAMSGKFLRNLPALLFVATLAVTAFIYGTPGVNDNHLIDLQVASLLLIAAQLSHAATARQKQWGIAVLALMVLASGVPALRHFKNHDLRFHRQRFQQVLARIGDSHRPILAENPIVPLLAGQQAYVADPWMLRLLRTRIPGLGDPLLAGLHNRAFGAVVLCMADPSTSYGRWWYETQQFGPGFQAALTQNYRLVATVDDQKIYLPISGELPGDPSAGPASPGK